MLDKDEVNLIKTNVTHSSEQRTIRHEKVYSVFGIYVGSLTHRQVSQHILVQDTIFQR